MPNRIPTVSTGLGRYLRRFPLTIKASGLEAASTTGPAIEVGDSSFAFVLLTVTASSAPTSLNFKIQCSEDGTNWVDSGLTGMTAVGAVSTATARFYAICGRYIRYVSTIVGTSYTYGVTASLT